MKTNQRRVPLWVLAIIIICMLPACFLVGAAMHSTSARVDGADLPLLKIYPFYVIACGYLAWLCYGRRSYLTWILLSILLLSHGAIYLLLTGIH